MPDPSRRRARWPGWTPFAVAGLAAVFAFRRLDDFDTWWHLAAGRWIVEHGAVPATDTLSHTVPDHAWINLQWVYDVLLYGLFQIGGASLLVLTAAVAFAAATAVTLRSATARSDSVTAAAVVTAAVVITEERFLIRPEMISFLLLALTLALLESLKRDHAARAWLLPLVILVWVNTHALFIVGLFAVGCYTAVAVAARFGLLPRVWASDNDLGGGALRRLIFAAVASVLVTLVNPFGVSGALFPLELFSRIDGSSDAFQIIGEFRRPFEVYATTPILLYRIYFVAAIVLGLAAAAKSLLARRRSHEAPRFDLGGALVFCGFAYLSYLARRNIGLFAIGTAPIVAGWIGLLTADIRRVAVRRRASQTVEILVLGVCAALAMFVATNGYYRANHLTKEFGLGVFETNFPIHAARFAEANALEPKLYNDLTAGGYLTWHAGVPGGVFIDGRLEVYDTEFFSRYVRALSDFSLWKRDADAFGVNTAIVFHRWPNRLRLIERLARDPEWALVYYDEVAAVFVRARGREQTVMRAREAFRKWRERTRARLARPGPRFGYPIERATALTSYATVAWTLGDPDDAIEAWRQVVELGALSAAEEGRIRYNLAWALARRGERAQARRYARSALGLLPGNEAVARLVEQLGGEE